MNSPLVRLIFLFVVLFVTVLKSHGADEIWKAGVARANITPKEPMLMGGFAKRTHAAEGKEMDLWLKALVLEDAAGNRAVILTCDLLAVRAPVYRRSLVRLKEKFGLDPAQIMLTASHTHCGPLLASRHDSFSALDESVRMPLEEFCKEFETKIIETTGAAIAALKPVHVAVAQGKAGFAANRRNNSQQNADKLVQQGALVGPVDHDVPVLTITESGGKLLAVLFGYACHNTTLDYYKWSGDYAGYAQIALEKSHPGATAMFIAGCGGDQDPLPRVRVELAERYGNMLAATVEETFLIPPAPLTSSLKTTMEMIPLNLGDIPTKAELEKLKESKTNFIRRWATRLLADMEAGKPFERTYPYPLQVWRFGGKQIMIGMGGEPVVDYSLKFKREFGPQTWVAGYCNDVMTYIPSLRVLNEDKPPLASPLWGYEGCQAMQVLGLPALRWADDVEDLITASARRLVKEVGAPSTIGTRHSTATNSNALLR